MKDSIEEAAERYIAKDNNNRYYNDFIAGAKWQLERSYSEEEVKMIMALTWLKCSDNNAEDFKDNRDEILKQFKR